MQITREDLIDGERFAALAHFRYCRGNDQPFLAALRARTTSDTIIFADTEDVRLLWPMLNVVPHLRVTLITHNGDGIVRRTGVRAFDADARLISKNVVRWYAQNVVAVDPRIVPIPIGLERDIWFPHLAKKQRLLEFRASDQPATKLLYVNHDIATNPRYRRAIYELFQAQPWATCRTGQNGQDYPRFLREIQQHHFVVSPLGNGIDCHRTWEALYLGRVPIVPSCYHTQRVYAGLPVIIIDDFTKATEAFLREWLAANTVRPVEKLKFSYYEAMIRQRRSD